MVLGLLSKEVADYGRHLSQYFNLFLVYASLGSDEKAHLLKLNVLSTFMTVALDEGPGPPIKYQYAELGKLYQVCFIGCFKDFHSLYYLLVAFKIVMTPSNLKVTRQFSFRFYISFIWVYITKYIPYLKSCICFTFFFVLYVIGSNDSSSLLFELNRLCAC